MYESRKAECIAAIQNVGAALFIIGIFSCCMAANAFTFIICFTLLMAGFLLVVIAETVVDKLEEIHRTQAHGKTASIHAPYGPDRLTYKLVERYSFIKYVQDNGVTLEEFIEDWSREGWNFDKVYNDYVVCAFGAEIQSREDVWKLISGGEQDEQNNIA